MVIHLAAIALGMLLDRIIGDPPNWPHPVRFIGKLISRLTKKWNHPPHACRNGFAMVAVAVVLVFAIVYAIVTAAYAVHWSIGLIVEALLIASGLAQKSLADAGLLVHRPLLAGDLPEARNKLSWIVGRDTEHLSESEIVRGTVETVSENTGDGVTAPLFWAFLLGAPGLWLYKTVNTCDSMVGYKNERFERFGFASARFDDVLNFIPSRMTGLLILLLTKNSTSRPFKERLYIWLRDARKHPSPNSGWLEAATAVQLGVQLGGVNSYGGTTSERARMGEPLHALEARHIKESVRHLNIAALGFFILLVIGGICIELA